MIKRKMVNVELGLVINKLHSVAHEETSHLLLITELQVYHFSLHHNIFIVLLIHSVSYLL